MQRVTGQKKAVAPVRAPPAKTESSERHEQSSTHSWSPSIDVFSKPAEPAVAIKKSRSAPSMNAASAKPAAEPVSELYLELRSKFQRKFQEYDALEKWMDRRLAIFEQLQKDLTTASGNASATERITNRVALETANLGSDKEYKWKMAEMSQLRNELDSLRTQIASQP